MTAEQALIEAGTARRSYRNPLHGFGTTFAWGLRRAITGRRVWIGILLAAGLGFLFGAGSQEGATDKLFAVWEAIDAMLLRVVAPVVALLMVAQGYSAEVRGGTLLYHLVRPVRRPVLYVSRFLSGWVLGVVASVALVGGVALSAPDVPLDIWLKLFVAFAALMSALGAIYYVFASLFKRGVVVGLVYTFLIEVTVGSMPGSIQKAAISHHARAIYHGWCDGWFAERSAAIRRSLNTDDRPIEEVIQNFGEVDFASPASSLLVLLVITAAALAIGVFFNKRRDFPLKD